MFRLHERTRLFFCRAGFFILCLGPTLFLSAAAVHYRSPSYLEAQRDEWAAVLSDKLGADVQVARLSYPDWDTALLEEIQLLDPETGNEMVHARYVEVTRDNGQWRIKAGQPEINAASLPELTRLVNERLLRGHALQLAPLQFEAREATFHSAGDAQTFQFVAGQLKTVETGKQADVTFQLAGSPAESPFRLAIQRLRTDSGATTTCQLDTAGSLLPCGSLAPLAPWLTRLGSESHFKGSASFEVEGGKTHITGSLSQVNLDALMSACFSQHKLTGLADIQVDQLQLTDGRIVEAVGTLQSRRGGVIDHRLLTALQHQLDLEPPAAAPLLRDSLVRYSHLAFGFRLDHEGISLSGDANPANAGVIMSRSTAILLVEPPRPVAPVAYLVKVFSPESVVQIPATPEAKSLLDWLPIPGLTPLNDDALPRAKNLRLTERHGVRSPN